MAEVVRAAIVRNTISWVAATCSSVEVHRRFGGTYRFQPQHRRVSQPVSGLVSKCDSLCSPHASCCFLAWLHLSTLKMEAIRSSESLMDFCRMTRQYDSEERNGCCERMKYEVWCKSGVASCNITVTITTFKEFFRRHDSNRSRFHYTELIGSSSKLLIFILELSGSNLHLDSNYNDFLAVFWISPGK
jgi:hypothetical protein